MEKDILYNAIEKFSENSNFELQLEKLFDREEKNGFDGKLRLNNLSKKFDFVFEVKKRLTLSKLPQIQKKINSSNLILISDYIPKSLKKYLKDKNISYLDTAGNAFISNNDGLFIFIETKKNAPSSSNKTNRAFSKSGLKVIYQILINEEIVNRSYRDIGQSSKVSIDTVGKVFKDLLKEKYLIKLDKKQFKVKNKERLLQEWVTIFNKILRPKLKQHRFKTRNFNISEIINISGPNSVGGELAADFLTNYLIPESAIIYTDQPFIDIAKKINLLPKDDGPIILIEKFWNDELKYNHKVVVHPILVYADLLNDPKPRNLETAQIIYNKYVKTTL